MKSAPHLLGEDRAEFERALDDALRTAHERPDLAAMSHRLTNDQLRGMALDARSLIAEAAAPEYEHYRDVREELRRPGPLPVPESPSPQPSSPSPSNRTSADSVATAPSGSSASRRPFASSASASYLPPTSVLGSPGTTGAGIIAVIAVLVPVLAAIAAVIFLLAGYLLKALGPAGPLADALITFGWFFASVMALGILAAGIGLLITAVRNGSTQIRSAEARAGEPAELAEAREEWRAALLERGIVPYLRRTLREAEESPSPSPAPTRTSGPGRDALRGSGPDAHHERERHRAAPDGRTRETAAGTGQDRGGDSYQNSDNPAQDQDASPDRDAYPNRDAYPDSDRGQDRGRSSDRDGSRGPDQPARHQLPKIGYSRPDYSSPAQGASSGRRPRYSSPDFSSPDYGGPDHQPD